MALESENSQNKEPRGRALQEFANGNLVTLRDGNTYLSWVESSDFDLSDPWSMHTQYVIAIKRALGGFEGDFFEAGIGDGRNVVAAGVHKKDARIIGVDVDDWRLDLARHNLDKACKPESRVDLYKKHVVTFLNELPVGEKLTGWGVACLPQAPSVETKNNADGFDPNEEALAKVRELTLDGYPVDEVGLTLNAGFLDALRTRVNQGQFDLLLTISHRVPRQIRNELFAKTGWEIAKGGKYSAEKPVQQDPDTGVAYVAAFDDGKRFFEKTKQGLYTPISAKEAEERRVASVENGGRDSLNVHHRLSVYHLQPAPKVLYAIQ